MILTCAYFIAFIAWDSCKIVGTFIAGSNEDGAPRETFLTKYEQILAVGVDTIKMAPMICVLVLAVRMRALGMGLNGPQGWAQDMMYFTAIALCTTLCATVAGPLIFGAKANKGVVDGDITFEMNNVILAAVFTVLLQSADGRDMPMSTALATTLVLTDMYFTVYCGIWISATLKQFFGPQGQIMGVGPASMYDTLIMMFDGAKSSLVFIPMLSILFMAARLRAMQVVGRDRAPQNWAQYCMWAAVVCIVFSGSLGFLGPLLNTEGNSTCVAVNDVLRLLTLFATHVGAFAVVFSMYFLTKENAGDLGLKDPATWTGETLKAGTDAVGITLF